MMPNLLLFLWLVVSATTLTARADDNKKKSAFKPRIAMVGAGVSSLNLASLLLEKYGWSDNIFIYEKLSEPSESAFSVKVNDNFGLKDVGTVYIPRSSFDIINVITDTHSNQNYQFVLDFEIASNYKKILTKYKVTLTHRRTFGLNTTDKTLVDCLQWLLDAGYSPQDLIYETIHVLEYYKLIKLLKYQNKGVLRYSDWVRHGLIIPGETLSGWGKRLKLPIMARYQAWIADIIAVAGPSLERSKAYYILKFGELFFVPFFQKLLVGFQITADHPMLAAFPYAKAVMADGRVAEEPYYVLVEGFQYLWDLMSDELVNEGVHIEYDTFVEKVHKIHTSDGSEDSEEENGKGKVQLIFRTLWNKKPKEAKEFDFVFLSVRTDDMLSVLSEYEFLEPYALYDMQTEYLPYISVAVFNISGHMPTWFSGKQFPIGPYAVYPAVELGGTSAFAEVYDCRVLYATLYEAYGSMAVWGVTDDVASGRSTLLGKKDRLGYCIAQFAKELAEKWDVPVTAEDVLYERIWSIAAQGQYFGEANNWNVLVEEMQGKDGLFFIGEAVAGYTVPVNVDFVCANVDGFYEIMKEKASPIARHCNADIKPLQCN